MKRLFSYIMIFVTPAIMVACAKKEETKVASTPLTNCINATTGCNTALYSAYANYGFAPYPSYSNSMYYGGYDIYGYGTSTNSTNLCGCTSLNGVTVYSNVAGLGCMDPKILQPVQTMAGYWYLASTGANQQWINTPQTSNISSSYSTLSCSQTAVQVCFMGYKDDCAQGFACRPTTTNSPVGVCVRN